ncbi:hypothetical protein WDL1P2_00064 (plasmid) [Variovorax sp. WDL1]|nr:hypothetical protein APY03_6888 [Variovorax sp. WDL1]PNG48844.1 hypothetical protein CHC06_06612 [Variovorax sp. B2]PNG49351.1 hypothetical protein CHC07_06260 [Variovorax sp. B4]VTV18355.1 hypothetical protein WDL1P2_00064 [Variovorax sp. WDL1]
MQVDGSASTGVQGNAVSYLWTLETKPSSSTAQLNNTTTQQAMLWPDVVGTYKLKLVVSSGGKTSEPAYTTIEAVAPGVLPPFVTFKASGLNVGTSVSVGGCSYFRNTVNFSNFWSFANFEPMPCFLSQPGVPDLEWRGSNSGGQLSDIALNVRYLGSSGISGKSEVTWANVSTISSYGFGLSAEPIELAKIPAGKATGTDFHHWMNAAYVQQFSTGGVLQYRIEGSMQPANVAPGWELDQSLTVVVTLEGPTFINSQPGYESIKVFERTFTADFDETIPLSLNWAQMPATFVNYGTYRVAVFNRVAFKRTSE